MNTKISKLVLAMGALMMAGGAMAIDSGSGSMGSSATIKDECSIGNSVSLAFGDLEMLTAGAQSTEASASTIGGTFDAICTNNSKSTPKLTFTSANAVATSTFRLVGADATSYIVYTLKESGGTAIVYNTAAAFTGFTADGTVDSLIITGSITPAEKAAKKVQTYSDTITILSSYSLAA